MSTVFYIYRVSFLLQRSYHRDLFPDALSKMKIANIKSSIEIEKFVNLGKAVDEIVSSKAQTDIDLSDAPDEFKGIALKYLLTTLYYILQYVTICNDCATVYIILL